MEVIGFKVTRDDYEARAKELVDELDRLVTQKELVVLQVVLEWDEFATMLPELHKRQTPKDSFSLAEYCPYGGNEYLSAPAKDLHFGGTFKGVALYYKDRPTPTL